MLINKIVGGNLNQGSGIAPKSRQPILIGAGLSLLLHALALWLLTAQAPVTVKPPPAREEGRITINLAAPAAPSLPPQSGLTPKPLPENSAKPTPSRKQARKPALAIERAPTAIAKVIPKAPEQEAVPFTVSPSDDMFMQLEAARKRRADARAQAGLPEPAPAAEEKAANDNRIALANIATSLGRPRPEDQANAGGVFQLKHVGYRDAEVYFRGWSANAKRDRTRLIPVELGTEIDIQTAVVKKMIEVIREERKGDFIWESHRLGKQFTLSARPQDGATLQKFLLREFFPDYLP